MASLQGFGSADVTTPFNYGSVADGIRHNPSLEQKLKKKYWKTKQTVIQKLHKSQDEFVVAGDADIDTKLEIAYHLRSSCHQLLQTLEKYCFRLRDMSAHELAFGEYLGAYSEKEYTNAGEVMKSAGKVLEMEAKARLTVLPGLQRLYQEMATFEASALSDLTISIQTLEKARTDYRAALLWMKDVSGKLHNPDYRDQLVRFRESQAAVKEAKARFDKLKVDLTEKIGMVNASRCNLLSRSLPTYQKSILAFSDSAASEFYRVLVNLRSHHHHQYKLHSDMEEIRDLESQELSESSLLSTLEGGVSPLTPKSPDKDDDDALIDVSSPTGLAGDGDRRTTKVGREAGQEDKEWPLVPLSPQGGAGESVSEIEKQAATMNDLPLSGVEADLRALQSELLQEFGSSDPPPGAAPLRGAAGKKEGPEGELFRPANMDLNDLLGLGLGLEGEATDVPAFGPMVSSEGAAGGAGQDGQKSGDMLADQWNNFSSFMTSTRTSTESSFSEWEKEFTAQPPPSTATEPTKDDPFLELDPLAAAKKQSKSASDGAESSGVADDLLSLNLSTSSALPPPQQSLVPTRPPSSLPPLSVLHPPFSSGLRQGVVGGAPHTGPHPPASSGPGRAAADKPSDKASDKPSDKAPDKKGTSWMNVFAHLDPLSNEKA
jgi:hypothetical protein